MRSLFVVLLLANVALVALDRGWFGQPLSERGRDPARLRAELRADTIRVPRLPGINAADEARRTPPAPAAAAAVPAAAAPPAEPTGVARPPDPDPSACVEWGAFNEADLPIARKWAHEHLPAALQSSRREPGKPGWMVVVPPLPSAAAAQTTAAQLGRDGIRDYFVIQEAGPYQHAISLGVFGTEAAARKQAAALQGQGVRNAKVVARAALGGKSWLRLDGIATADRHAIEGARDLFDRPTVRDCR